MAKKESAKSESDTKKTATGGLWIVGVTLGNLPGYSPEQMALWNLVGIYDSHKKAYEAACSIEVGTTFIRRFKMNATSSAVYRGPWSKGHPGFEPVDAS